MQLSDFRFDLPDALMARFPNPVRSGSRLMRVDSATGQISHHIFKEMLAMVDSKDLLIFNNTRVIPARLFGQKASGGKIEVLIERLLDSHRVLAHIRASKAPKPGAELLLEGQLQATMVQRQGDLFELHFKGECDVLKLIEQVGHMPLPPYIDRADLAEDKERYQTVYNQKPGAVAAPTAGLHFDESLLSALRDKGVAMEFVTLHVGAGTFQPVRVDNIFEHQMHAEYIEVSEQVCQAIADCKARGGRVIAVGTTSVRSLESAARAAKSQLIAPFYGDTDIFIYPGFEFKVVDAMFTNFHLSESTLLMLVSAFAGKKLIEQAYQTAISEQYRFFSYGDSMFLANRVQPELALA